jgi:general secretion pathway protein L
MPDESDADVYLQSRSGLAALGRLDIRPEEHPKESLRTILEERGLARAAYGGRLGVCIRIPAMKAARTIADLPLAAEENLEDVVSFELNRHTPFSADQAVFWYRVIDRDTTARRLRVELIVVPNPIFDQFNKVAHALDLDPDRIDVAEPGGNLAASGNLLRDKVARGTRRADTLTYALAALVAGLVVIALYLPIYIARQRADVVAQQFAARKATIEERAKLQTEIAAARRENNFLIDRKMERPSVSELLFDTTHILPDNAWLQDWLLNGNQVLLTGYAESASSLIPLLERSHIFGGTNFRSPVTQDPRTGRERFNIAADIIGSEKR